MKLGNSMVKHLNESGISWKLPSQCKVYVRNLAGAKTRNMKDYLKSSLGKSPNHFILHVRKNDLNSERHSELIAILIADLAASLKNRTYNVSISNIIVRTNIQELREKALTVNKEISEICR